MPRQVMRAARGSSLPIKDYATSKQVSYVCGLILDQGWTGFDIPYVIAGYLGRKRQVNPDKLTRAQATKVIKKLVQMREYNARMDGDNDWSWYADGDGPNW